jgi:hypothetical protein
MRDVLEEYASNTGVLACVDPDGEAYAITLAGQTVRTRLIRAWAAAYAERRKE